MKEQQIQELHKELEQLEALPNSLSAEKNIINWVARCVKMFYTIDLDSQLINLFIQYFQKKDIEIEDNTGLRISGHPIPKKLIHKIGSFTCGDDRLLGDSYNYVPSTEKVIFTVARQELDKLNEKFDIIPHKLLQHISDTQSLAHIHSSLVLIENNYQDGDTDGMMRNTITLLENILDLEPTVTKERNLLNKLRLILEDSDIRKKFGIEKEIIEALNHSRIIRNYEATHTKVTIIYDIPMITAVCCVSIVILTLRFTLASGLLIENS